MRISDWSSDVCSSDLEELRAEAFELVRTDRRGDCRPCRGEVGLNEGIAEAAHGEAGRCIVMPQPAAVAQHADSGPKSVCLSAQGAELRGGMILVRRLVEPQVVARQHLVGAEDRTSTRLTSSH